MLKNTLILRLWNAPEHGPRKVLAKYMLQLEKSSLAMDRGEGKPKVNAHECLSESRAVMTSEGGEASSVQATTVEFTCKWVAKGVEEESPRIPYHAVRCT